MSDAIQTIDGDNWRDFLSEGTAFLMVGKTDCDACAKWTEELKTYLAENNEFDNVKFGKIDLKTRGLLEFKKENAEWLKDLTVLPFNLIYKDGEKVKDFAGSGIERMQNRLRRISNP